MVIDGVELKTLGVFPSMMTVPDCIVVASNKIGHGHGEAKFYVASKEEMYSFYGGENFTANCFMLKKDLLAYLDAIRNEYFSPSQEYQKKDKLPELWNDRLSMVSKLDDIVRFRIKDQYQIAGPRGYINSEDENYQLIRQLALPLVSYVYVEKVGSEKDPMYYWKLFVDFEAIWERQSEPLVFKYGKKSEQSDTPVEEISKKEESRRAEVRYARDGQGKYREKLLEQCPFCPFTMIADERLLIASHIKPWAASDDDEKIDPYNGYMLSPLYDKLFDRGFITFTENRHIILSDVISPLNWKRMGIKNDVYIGMLPMDEKRVKYLDFHHNSVFKGSFALGK